MLEQELEKLEKLYLEKLTNLVNAQFIKNVVPLLMRDNLSFTVMNGFPQTYSAKGERTETPDYVVQYWEKYDIMGHPIGFKLDDYNIHDLNFSQCDIDNFKKRMESVNENDAFLSLWQTVHLF